MSVEVTHDGPVTRVTLQRPEVLNALDIEHLQALLEALDAFRLEKDQRVLVLKGAGRAFCVGADIKAMTLMSAADFERAANLYQALARTAAQTLKPLIASVQGYALGGGLEIALICDLRIAATSAKFGLPDAPLGFSPTGGLSYLLPRLVGVGRAMHLLMSAQQIDAKTAEQIGLVSRVVVDDDLESQTNEWAQSMAKYPATGVRNIKHLMVSAYTLNFEQALGLEAQYDSECYADPETQANLATFVRVRAKDQ